MKRRISFYVLFIFIFTFSYSRAQVKDRSLLTLERIFSSREFSPERFGPAKWFNNGNGYTTLEPTKFAPNGMDIVLYDNETGKRRILVSADKLIPAGKTSPLNISNYFWSSDGNRLLIFTNTKRVWRRNTRGDYWILDLKTDELWKLGGNAKPSTLMFATFSPDGKKVAYVCEKNLFVQDLTNKQITQLTSDGGKNIINGTSDWVYEEEFSLRNGFRWSPDSKLIAYWQFNTEGVRIFYLINYTDSLYPVLKPIPYPKAGTTNSACRVGVVNVNGGKTIWMKVPGDPRNNYIPRMEWADNSKEIVIQHLNRLQNTNQVILCNAYTGEVNTIYTDHDDAWVEVVNNIRWIDNGKYFIWVSEQDGWRHIYSISRTGEKVKLITPGSFDIINISSIDEKNGWLYYIASPNNPIQRYLFRVPLDGSGKYEQLTPADQKGTHNYQISPNSRWAFHTYSSFDEPPITELIRLPEHTTVRILVDNSKLRTKVHALKRLPTEFFRVDIGKGIKLDAWMIKPYNFDPSMRYPLLFHVYGEPAGQTVLDRWGGTRYLWHQMLAQQGYLVMSVDNRGTPAPRGRNWRKCIYRKIGIIASIDQAAAAKAIIKKFPFVDPERIGIWGWSGGGSMTLNMLFRYPDIYRTGMSVAPVSNQRYYDTIYQERYMGLPEDNPEGYKNGSPITFAHQLKGNLLIVHGTGDDNVHFQSTEAVVNELIKHNKKFTMMAYPNRSHGIYEGKNTTKHLFELLTRYLKENLPAGPVAK
ncbi:S9 family peptidase [candidate division KSB1 bacterium]|nr:MAG: S9 family peptidase [candidate division KSB1 bacterium]